jgi:hypothetical protein
MLQDLPCTSNERLRKKQLTKIKRAELKATQQEPECLQAAKYLEAEPASIQREVDTELARSETGSLRAPILPKMRVVLKF